MKNSLRFAFLFLCFQSLTFAQAVWHDDFTKAHALAKQEKKLVLLNFTGSDWCGWCKKMKADVLLKKEFLEYAAKNVVLVDVDFPESKEQTASIKKTNQTLKQKYGANGYPTFVLIDADGKELGRHVGYSQGGPAKFIAKLDRFRQSAVPAAK